MNDDKDYYYSWFTPDGSIWNNGGGNPAHYGPTTRKDIESSFSTEYIDKHLNPGNYVVYGIDQDKVRAGIGERIGGSKAPKAPADYYNDEFNEAYHKWQVFFQTEP